MLFFRPKIGTKNETPRLYDEAAVPSALVHARTGRKRWSERDWRMLYPVLLFSERSKFHTSTRSGLGALIGEWKANGLKQETTKGAIGDSADSASKAAKRHAANKWATFLFKT